MQFKIAKQADYEKVKSFYYTLIDSMAAAPFKPGWKKDVYPSQDFLINSIKKGDLLIGEIDKQMISCMVINNEYNEGYNAVKWSINAKDSQVFVIHALGVTAAFSGKGIAKQMVEKAIEIAGESNIKTIRLDVLCGNLPAEKAYTKMGFVYVDTIKMFYEDTGWTDFKLFEYLL